MTTQAKMACENDLRSLASKSTGKCVHTVDSVLFVGSVSEYEKLNRPHAYDIVVSCAVRRTVTGELVKSKKTCRVTDTGNVEWIAA